MKNIDSILIANRGEIACRIIKTAKQMGIKTVALCSTIDINALHTKVADEVFVLDGTSSLETYLNIEKIVKVIQTANVDAVHPGYGFLSENANFAKAVIDNNCTFIGPTPEVIETMGSKLNSKLLAKKSGVPTLDSIDVTSLTKEELLKSVNREDLPVLIKASLGGGGKGMRVVYNLDELQEAVETAKREAKSAFSDETVFVEKYIENPRHIEIQILADLFGNTFGVFERECSIQRRHQKIIEEAPCAILTDELRKNISDAAVSIAKSVNYTNAGTVEFILDQEGNFYFLEMNTRLQVEHPVTEAISGLDLVKLQIEIAQGRSLEDLKISSPNGHAVELRLYAEDPFKDFMPSPGHINSFEIDENIVRLDTGYSNNSEVSSIYDPMIAKIIAHGNDRHEAILKLKYALKSAKINGIVTNKDLLIGILEESEFVEAKTDTFYLQRHKPETLTYCLDETRVFQAAVAATVAVAVKAKSTLVNQSALPIGWRNLRSQLEILKFTSNNPCFKELIVKYSFDRYNNLDAIIVNETSLNSKIVTVDTEKIGILTNNSLCYFNYEIFDQSRIWVGTPLGDIEFKKVPEFVDPAESVVAGSIIAPMPGTITKILAEENASVDIGQDLLIIEAMKMENKVVTPIAGTVASIMVKVGDQVSNNQVLAIIKEEQTIEE